MYQKMLVPLDGSKLAEVAFTYAKELAGRLGIDTILLNIYSPEESWSTPMHEAYINHAVEIIRREIRKLQKREGIQPKGKPVEVRGELAKGAPAETIMRYAEQNDVDLILTTTQARSGLRRWVLGDIADKVLRTAKIPILLVRAGIPDEILYDQWPKRTILVPLDGSKLSESVLPHVEVLAQQAGKKPTEVVLLRVCEPPPIPSYYAPEFSEVPLNWGQYMEQEVNRCKKTAQEYLAGIEKQLKKSNINVRSEILVGKTADEIVNYVKKNPFNLIVTVTHGRAGLSRWVYGSVTESILLGVRSPILLVRPH